MRTTWFPSPSLTEIERRQERQTRASPNNLRSGPPCRPGYWLAGQAVGGQTRRRDMSSTTASQEELKAHRVPLAWRDQCSAYVVTVYSYALSHNLLLADHDHIVPRLPLESS